MLPFLQVWKPRPPATCGSVEACERGSSRGSSTEFPAWGLLGLDLLPLVPALGFVLVSGLPCCPWSDVRTWSDHSPLQNLHFGGWK